MQVIDRAATLFRSRGHSLPIARPLSSDRACFSDVSVFPDSMCGVTLPYWAGANPFRSRGRQSFPIARAPIPSDRAGVSSSSSSGCGLVAPSLSPRSPRWTLDLMGSGAVVEKSRRFRRNGGLFGVRWGVAAHEMFDALDELESLPFFAVPSHASVVWCTTLRVV